MPTAAKTFTEAEHRAARERFLKSWVLCCHLTGPYPDHVSYPRGSSYPVGVVGPTPLHVLDARIARARRPAQPDHVDADAEVAEVVDEREAWRRIEVDELTGAAATFARQALEAGREVAARQAGATVQVGVRSRELNRVEIRATWSAGRTKGIVLGGRVVSSADAKAAL